MDDCTAKGHGTGFLRASSGQPPSKERMKSGLVKLRETLEHSALHHEEDPDVVLAMGVVVPMIDDFITKLDRIPASDLDPWMITLWETMKALAKAERERGEERQ